MRGLSLTQPWASLVALDAKEFETRSWSTSYRGTIFLHASKAFPKDCRHLCSSDPFHRVLAAAGYTAETLPLGAIVAVVTLTDVEATESRVRLWLSRRSGSVWNDHDRREHTFGNYGPGRFAWRLAHVRRLAEPVACTGALGLWRVPDRVIAAVSHQVTLGTQADREAGERSSHLPSRSHEWPTTA